MHIKHFFKLSVVCFFISLFQMSCDSVGKNGPLPEGYEWAYGTWRRLDDGSEIRIENDLIYVPIFESDDMFPYYAQPGLSYDIEICNGKIELYYEGICAYSEYVVLDSVNKAVVECVDEYDSVTEEWISYERRYQKVRPKYDKNTVDSCNAVISMFKQEVCGDWRDVNLKKFDDGLKIDNDYWYVLFASRKGFMQDLDGCMYIYDAQKDELIIDETSACGVDVEISDNLIRRFHRYGPEQERLEMIRLRDEQLTRSMIGNTYKNDMWFYGKTNNAMTYYQDLYQQFALSSRMTFKNNGVGIFEIYELTSTMPQFWKKGQSLRFGWVIDNGVLILTSNYDGEQSVDEFHIREVNGHVISFWDVAFDDPMNVDNKREHTYNIMW